ncbi:MAG: UvrD-helicase domain-containing protein [Deltaproteobacteria bacterium]|nr:UvrD-helicase domain-containing protein [Deltaproteobacteria bacterium]
MAVSDDQDIRERAGRDLRQSYIVDAGAGTGKTTVLISRAMGAIASGKTALDKIVAITFTEKAAGELKVRLRGELEKALRNFDSERWSSVRNALADIERAQISTIHSFCATLLRERPVEAGVDPGFEVLDETAANILLDQSWEQWLEREMDQATGVLAEALEAGIRIEELYGLGKFLIRHRDASKAPEPVEERPQPFLDKLSKGLARLKELQSACASQSDRAWIQIEALEESCGALKEPAALRRLLARSLALRPNEGNQKNWTSKEALAEVKRLIAELREGHEEIVQAMSHNLAVALLRWLNGYVSHYEAAKRERGCLDFFDLLYRTRELLKHNREVRRYFQSRFDYILVDEFQDTDPLQVEIVFFLAESSPKAGDWTKVELKPGKLFLVGDPKQSIYRFRRADIETYHAAEKILSRQGEVLDLTLNFRSRPRVVDWVNSLFSTLIRPPEQGSYQPRYRPIAPSLPDKGEASVIFLPSSPQIPAGSGAAGELRMAEARTIAAFLRKIVSEGLPVWDRRDGSKRKIGYGDVGILFRAKAAMDVYEEEFRDFEIPYRVAGGRRYYSRQEMGALLAVLSAINNPKDRAALTAALRSPFFSVSDEDLFLFSRAGNGLDYLESRTADGSAPESIRNSFRLLSEIHELRNRMPVPLFLLRLYEASRILPFLYLKPQGDQKVANLLKVVDMAHSLARQGLVTLRSFVQFLTKMESAEAEEGESPLAEESEDVARLMTIHKAKGLEFPLVILGDAAYQGRSRMGEGIVNRQAGHLEIRLGSQLATRGWEAAAAQEELREEAEDCRLLYVATTRARDYLVIPLVTGEKKRFLGALWQDLEFSGEIPWGRELHPYGDAGPSVRVYDSRKLNVEKKELRPFRISVAAKKRRGDPRSLDRFYTWQREIEELRKGGKKGARILTASAVATPEKEAAAVQGLGKGRGALFGSFVHELLCRIDLSNPEGLATVALALGKKYGLRDDEALKGVEIITWGLKSDLLQRAARAEGLWRELPFVYVQNGTLIEGFVDLVFEEGEELVIVDFKTDRVMGQELEERTRLYATQGLVYAMALERITRKKVKEVVFLFLSAKAEKSIPLEQSEFRRVERLVEEVSAGETSSLIAN